MQLENHKGLSNEIKIKLGLLIKEVRKYKYQESILNGTSNKYTKENLCLDICHINTLYKLETETVKKDSIYYQLLERLDLEFSVSELEFRENTNILNHFLNVDFYQAIEFKDKTILNQIKERLEKIDFKKDCITNMNKFLMVTFIKTIQNEYPQENIINLFMGLLDYFEFVYKCFAYHFLGVNYLVLKSYKEAKNYLLEARTLYLIYNINPGLINDELIVSFEHNNHILDAVRLSNEMEKYYLSSDNYNRLINVYLFLANFYLMVNAMEQATLYYSLSIETSEKNNLSITNRSNLDYNWALKHFKSEEYTKALEYCHLANLYCQDQCQKIEILNLLIILFKKTNQNEIDELLEEGKKFLEYTDEYNQLLFRYFLYKHDHHDYYRKFATEKVLPYLKKFRDKREILIFIYEDLYEV